MTPKNAANYETIYKMGSVNVISSDTVPFKWHVRFTPLPI